MKARAYPMLLLAALNLVTGCENPAPTEQALNDDKNSLMMGSNLGEIGKIVAEVNRGEPTDTDGDGFAETLMTTAADGTIYYEVMNPNGYVRFYWVKYPDGNEHTLSDVNGDGNTDYQEDVFVNSEKKTWIERRIKQYDRNFDGYPEERKTIEFDRENRLMIVTEERDDEGSGNYIIVNKWTRPLQNLFEERSPESHQNRIIIKKKSTSHDAHEGFLVDADATLCGDVGNAKKNMQKIIEALECAFDHGRSCLEETNHDYFDKINKLLNMLRIFPLLLECRSLESGYAGYTPGNTLLPVIQIDPSRAFWGCDSDDADCLQQEEESLCSLLLHELLHNAGETGDKNHDEGTDQVYACGRYCGFCQEGPFSKNKDCAICAKFGGDPLQCGSIEYVQAGPCSDTYAVCHAGLGCIADACETCRELEIYTCDMEKAEMTFIDHFCCLKCPDNCNASNDFPCKGEMPTPKDTCDQPLPMCAKH